jgi:hypothetical protein
MSHRVFPKSYPRFPRVPLLDDDQPTASLADSLTRHESSRHFSSARIGYSQLCSVLSTFRVAHTDGASERPTGPLERPRVPIELYVVALGVIGLQPRTIYHLAIRDRALETLWPLDAAIAVDRLVAGQPSASALLVLTSMVARLRSTYGERALPMSLLEAGHIGQNLLLAAASAELDAGPLFDFAADDVKRALDLGEDEVPLHAIALGSRVG